MLHIRKLNPSLNSQENSVKLTLIIINVQFNISITRDVEKYINRNRQLKLSDQFYIDIFF